MYQPYLLPMQRSLEKMTSDELKEFLNDDEKLENYVTEAIIELETQKDGMLTENRTLAESNLTLEPKLVELRGKVAELSEEGKGLCTSVQDKLNEIKSKSGSMSQDAALAKLEVAAMESEEESEKIVKSFLENEQTLDAFLEQFMSLRKTMHLRKIKVEKMKDLIKNPRQGRFDSFFPTNFSGGTPYLMASGGTPYPLGPMQMPMPGLPRPY